MRSSLMTAENSAPPLSQIPVMSSSADQNRSTQATAGPSYPVATMATIKIPQMRVLQSAPSKSDPTNHMHHQEQTQQQLLQSQQLHQIQILKTIPSSKGDILVPSALSTVSSGKVNKGPAIISIPRTKVTQSAKMSSKLKVGDTIVIPAKALNSFNSPTNVGAQPILITSDQGANTPGQIIFSTPTKFGSPETKSPILVKPALPLQSEQTCGIVSYPASTSLLNTQSSPSRPHTLSASPWTPSPMRYKRSNECSDQDCFLESIKKSRRTLSAHEKGSKGLRHFAMLVCEKVKQKITTTYNEVADELVSEYSSSQRHFNDQQYDQKNIRRRVYDALNVLMAMNIIYKDKKDIHWVGLPTNSAQELQSLQLDKRRREQKIKQKTAQLHELILQQIAFKNLVQRNKHLQHGQGPPASNSAIQLPFIIVNTSKKTVIDCSISNDKYEYLFNFDNTFEIHDDIEVLKRMGMAYGLERGTCSKEDLRSAQSLVPPVLRTYLEEMAGQNAESPAFTDSKALSSGYGDESADEGERYSAFPFDGPGPGQSSLKTDLEDHDVSIIVDGSDESRVNCTRISEPGRSALTRSPPHVEALSVLRNVPSSSIGFDIDCLPTTRHTLADFET